MGKEKDDKGKKRADKYEEKVTFDGNFADMIGISVKDAEKRIEERKQSVIWSDEKKNEPMNLGQIANALPNDFPPQYVIRFVLTNNSKYEWEYHSKEKRDEEYKLVKEALDKWRS